MVIMAIFNAILLFVNKKKVIFFFFTKIFLINQMQVQVINFGINVDY